MSSFSDSMDRDANRQVLNGDYPFRTKKTITFAGATTDAWGDDGGALDGGAIFTVTGVVQVKLIGEVTTSLAGGAIIEVGIDGATAIFMPQETDTNLDAGHVWINEGTPAAYYIIGEEQAAADNLPEYILNGQDIILTVTNNDNTDSGVIDFFALWKPISDDGSIVASSN
jgi:hypothetical protein